MQFGVFTKRQIIRMADAELFAELAQGIEEGIVSTSPSSLTKLYQKYDESFFRDMDYGNAISEAIEFISAEMGELRNTYMMKPYALHSLVFSLMYNAGRVPALNYEDEFPEPRGRFAVNASAAQLCLLELAQAHETKDTSERFAEYVWGCSGGTNRANRRAARVKAILRCLQRS